MTLATGALSIMLPVILLGVAGAWFGRPPAAIKSDLAVELESRVQQAPPRVVVLGNSLAESAIDEPLLERALTRASTGGNPVEVAELTVSGSLPVVWYVVLENVVYGTGLTPDLVIIPSTLDFFLRTDTGRDEQQLNLSWLSAEHEPVVDRVTHGRDSPSPMWERLKRARSAQRADIMAAVREISVGLVFRLPRPAEGGLRGRGQVISTPALERVFGDRGAVDLELNLRVIPIVEVHRAPGADPSPPAEASYVAALVDLATSRGSHIVFVAVPQPGRRSASRGPDTERLADLRNYLNRHGAGWVDLSALEMPRDAFGDRFHLADSGSSVFTQALSDELLRHRWLEASK